MNTYFNELLQVLIRYAEDGNRELLLRDLEIIDHEKRGFDANIERQWIALEAKKAEKCKDCAEVRWHENCAA